jgi:hypothetical protein
MAAEEYSLVEALLRARKLLVDLERHLDNAAQGTNLAEVGRAWVRAAQIERVLRSVLPPGATEVAEAALAATRAAPKRQAAPKQDDPTR